MNESINQRISALQERVRKYQEQIRALGDDSNKADTLRGEFATHIASELGDMVAKGANASDIQKVQDLLRSVFEPMPNSYAADVSEECEDYKTDEEYFEDCEIETHLFLVEAEWIKGFEKGSLTKSEFLDKLTKNESLVLENTSEIIDLIVNDYDEEKSMFIGKIIAGPSGEALVPDAVTIRNEDGDSRMIADPVTFQTEEEVAVIYNTLSGITEQEFQKRFDVKKLAKADAFIWCDDVKTIKKIQAEILALALEDFNKLCYIYKKACENKSCVILM